LSIRDARRAATGLRARLAAEAPVLPPARTTPGEVIARVGGLRAAYGPALVLRGVDLELRAGEVVALMGRNGAGKSTLLRALVGLHPPAGGGVEVAGRRPSTLEPGEIVHLAGFVPQDASVLLTADTVAAECAAADRDAGLAHGSTRVLLERLLPGLDPQAHPRDLSEGQRLALALAVVLVSGPPLVLLDEPTRGLDYPAKDRLVEQLRALATEGRAVVLATHDVEVVARAADRVVVLAEGEVVADGPARDVVTHSPVFAPQVAKILAPLPLLTVAEVERALVGASA